MILNKPREEAWALLTEYTDSQSLITHALSVETVMRYMAQKHGEDQNTWGVVGLLHDLDWDRFPDEHCSKAREILAAHGWPEEFIHAVESHAWNIYTDVMPVTTLEKTLYAIDELTGFVVACALVRPSRSVSDLKVKSVTKKWRRKDFASNVDRGVIESGADLLQVKLEDLIEDVIQALRTNAQALGL